MLKIQCPKCNKSFFWTDEMPTQGACPTPGCGWPYNVHDELGKNVSRREGIQESKTLHCPSCRGEIAARFMICPHCRSVVLGNYSLRKIHFFLAVCVILFLLSIIFNFGMK
jgi:hypothetical protein